MFQFVQRWWKSLEENPVPNDGIIVSLSELSVLWLKYNDNFTPQPKSIENNPQTTDQVQQVNPVCDTVEGSPSLPSALTGEDQQYIGPPPLESTEFIRNTVKPYEQICRELNALTLIYNIIGLLDKDGGCPSIVLIGKESQTSELNSWESALAKVSLRSHSYRVASLSIEMLKMTYKDYYPLIPTMLVAALGHDIGKIPSLREGKHYSKADHPIIGADNVSAMCTEKPSRWLAEAIAMIREHHRHPINSQLINLLRIADGKAREEEIADNTTLKSQPWNEWFDAREMLELVRLAINVTQTGNKFKAFSHNGVVYCDPSLLYEAAQTLAKKKNVIDISLARLSDKEKAIKAVVASLRRIGAISSEIGQEYYCRQYELSYGNSHTTKKILTPFNIEVFG